MKLLLEEGHCLITSLLNQNARQIIQNKNHNLTRNTYMICKMLYNP